MDDKLHVGKLLNVLLAKRQPQGRHLAIDEVALQQVVLGDSDLPLDHRVDVFFTEDVNERMSILQERMEAGTTTETESQEFQSLLSLVEQSTCAASDQSVDDFATVFNGSPFIRASLFRGDEEDCVRVQLGDEAYLFAHKTLDYRSHLEARLVSEDHDDANAPSP